MTKTLTFLMMVCLSAEASTYYVDFSGGSDAANGTSTSTPWQHCPGDSLATGTPASATLSSGDTVIFKGGVRYQSSITLNSFRGTAGSPITYDGNSAGSFGTGRAILDGGHIDSNTRRYGFTADRVGGLTFTSFDFTGFGGYTNIFWVCGSLPSSVDGQGLLLTRCTNVVIANSFFYDIGAWTNAANMHQQRMDGDGIKIDRGGGTITVTNCDFTHIGHAGVWLNSWDAAGVTNVSVLGCNFHDPPRWGVALETTANNVLLNNVTIDKCTFFNLVPLGPSNWLGCPGEFPHFDGIICLIGNNPISTNCTLGTVASPITIRNCDFYNNNPDTTLTGGTAMIFLTAWGGTTWIYNNRFINVLNQGEGAIYVQDVVPATNGSTAANYLFANNSFYDDRSGVYLVTVTAGWWPTNGTIRVLNNVFYKTDTAFMKSVMIGDQAGDDPTELDYNVYLTARPDLNIAEVNISGTRTSKTLAGLQALGFEAHGKYGNPLYADTSYGLGANSSLNNLHLSLGSPAIDSGTNLSSIFTTDKDGVARPQGSAWDIGAYEFIFPTVNATTANIGSIQRAP